ncbi:hypothetical protein, partial [Klebsiella variicola]|uniref:hypothetical protein n=1 Tax=Klebsiella variicola TaxID=244366 RepID=UPI001C4052D2
HNDSASCPRSAASEAVSANAMVLTTAPQHNAAPPNNHIYHLTMLSMIISDIVTVLTSIVCTKVFL